MAKFELKNITRNQWLFAVAVLVLYLYSSQGGSELAAIECPEGDTSCKIKEGLRPVWDWMLDNVLWSLLIIGGLAFTAYSLDWFKIKKKRGAEV